MFDVVLFHSHGLGSFDFSVMDGGQLEDVNRLAAERHVFLCPTIYLKESGLDELEDMFRAFTERKADGGLQRILSFSLEGPALGRRGGIPRGTVWSPNVRQWAKICSWFSLGLTYIVMAPDVLELDEPLDDGLRFANLLDWIYEGGGRVALGHFAGRSAVEAAQRTMNVMSHLESRYQRSPYLVLTDHLFNDMPRNFLHSFRSKEQRSTREQVLAPIISRPWQSCELDELLGLVPATLLNLAREGRLTPAMNFDGGHVDLAVCSRVVEFLGSGRLIAMTDHTEMDSLAHEPLTLDPETSLLYRDDGVLAASSVPHERQMQNMRGIGIDELGVKQMFSGTPYQALTFVPLPVRATK